LRFLKRDGGFLTVKTVNQLKTATKIVFFCLCAHAASAANVTQVNRYATVENKPLTSQINPLLTVQQIHFPQQIHTVGEALTHWIHYSGYALVDEKARSQALKDIMNQPLPQVVRNLGPLTVQDGLEVLVGQQVFSLIQDPLHRQVNFKLKPQYAKAQTNLQGKKA
jgi:type IV pili sensor histidine kinase/response regulator